MTFEYVRLSSPEITYTKKNFLHSELSILSLMKSYKEYQRLRKEEIELRLKLKKCVEETQGHLRLLEALLPKVSLAPKEDKEKKVAKEQLHELEAEEHALDHEIEDIRKRLAKLG